MKRTHVLDKELLQHHQLSIVSKPELNTSICLNMEGAHLPLQEKAPGLRVRAVSSVQLPRLLAAGSPQRKQT